MSAEPDKLWRNIEKEEGIKVESVEILDEQYIVEDKAYLVEVAFKDNTPTRYYVMTGFYWDLELETEDKQEALDYFEGLIYNEEKEKY